MSEKEMIQNNKELIPLEYYLEEYRKADPAQLAKRCGAQYIETEPGTGVFHLTFMGRPFEIGFPEFSVKCLDQLDVYNPLNDKNQAKIMVVRYLLEACKIEPSGKYLTFRDVPWGEVYIQQFTGRCIQRLAFTFGNRLSVFAEKMENLGAVKVKGGDVAYEFEIFPGFGVRFQLWAGDDEFPPSAQILFSDNFAAAFHAEDLVVAAEIGIGALKFM